MDHHDGARPTPVGIRLRLLSEQDGESSRPNPVRTFGGAGIRAGQAAVGVVAQAARAEAPTIALQNQRHAAAGDSPARRAFSASAGPWLMRGPRTDHSGRHGSDLPDGLRFAALDGAQSSAVQPGELILGKVRVPDAVRPDAQNLFLSNDPYDGTTSSGPVYYRFYDERRDLKLNGQQHQRGRLGTVCTFSHLARSVNWLEVAAGQPVAATIDTLARSSAEQLAYLRSTKRPSCR